MRNLRHSIYRLKPCKVCVGGLSRGHLQRHRESLRRNAMQKDDEFILDNTWAGVILAVSVVICALGLVVCFVCALGYLMGY